MSEPLEPTEPNVEEIDVEAVDEPDGSDEGYVDPADTYTEGPGE